MKLLEYADRDMMMIDVANVLAGELGAALRGNDEVLLAVPGGSTPAPVFDSLCAADLDWSRVRVVPTDERWVPEEDGRSNAKLIRTRLLVDRAAAAEFVSLYTGDETPAAAEQALAERLAPLLPVHVMLLGMGTDMHTASLFPGAAGLEEALDPQAPPVRAVVAHGITEPRITLTLPVLEGALARHLVITGDEKRATLERARDVDDPRVAPVSALLAGTTVHWAE